MIDKVSLRNKNSQKRKVFVIGLDCAEPELVFKKWRNHLPNLSWLADNGLYGDLESSIPAITVPAWSSMLSSRDPGTLGIYGFRNRSDRSYNNMAIATSRLLKHQRVWDYLADNGKQSVMIGVPQTYPVPNVNGHLISGFLTPNIQFDFTSPRSLKSEIINLVPNYDFDVPKFRTDDKDWLLEQIIRMTEKRFKVIDYMLTSKPWEFFMLMEIGVDRIQHGFWSYYDPQHHKHKKGNPYENVILDYYVMLDKKIGEWLERLDKETAVLVVSDHGAQRMDGGICINEWLWREGYLRFKDEPAIGKPHRFEDLEVDWSRTTAWGSGGYYGRVFLNVRGREPQGVVSPSKYYEVRQELASKLAAIPDQMGRSLDTKIFSPDEIYKEVNGVAPDLIVYFGNLLWRSVGSVGHGAIHTLENDTGPDDCNHKQQGLVIYYDPLNPSGKQEVKNAQLMDVAPTLLETFGIRPPKNMQGKHLRFRLN